MRYVLVAGSCLGAWVWQRVQARLVLSHQHVDAVTLTGLAERSHLYSPDLALDTHLQDIRAAIEFSHSDDVVLVGHSFAGLLVAALAAEIPQRVMHLVYVDAILPSTGETWASHHPSDTVEKRLAGAKQSGINALMPVDAGTYGLTGFEREWVNRWQTPHPLSYYQSPIDFDEHNLAYIPCTYIDCHQPAASAVTKSRKRAKQQTGLSYVSLATGHLPMVSAPNELSRILLELA
jgi:pimeloyl-ACP methyl ester carboxylesterase